jgi:D-arabinitol 4-dehydrogenase
MNSKATPLLLATSYDRSACEIGMVHVGPGAFHRAHQAYYCDAMMETSNDLSWGIAAVNLRAAETADLLALKSADDGYVLKTVCATREAEFRQVRSHICFADWSQDSASAENLLVLPSVKLVTITVTESGYYMDEDSRLNLSHPVINAEIRGDDKSSIYAYLKAGLTKRRIENSGPISVLCCDNLRGNGELLQQNFKTYLDSCNDQALIDWLDNNASFPSSMVDRITPKPTSQLSDEVADLFGRKNDPSVLSEDFIQWVLEDNFAAVKPPLDQAGVQIVSSVEPYEEAKIRVLNGGHTCLTYLGALRGLQTFDQAMADPQLLEHFLRYENDEVLPALPDDLPFDKNEYLTIITSRFQNPYVVDSLQRVCMDGVSKFPIFILPTIIKNFEQGRVPERAIVSVASWYVFAKRIHDGHMNFDYIEPNMHVLEPYLKDGRKMDFAKAKSLWGALPQEFPEFSTTLCREIDILDREYPARN